LGSFGKDEKTAKEQFMKMAGIEGELIWRTHENQNWEFMFFTIERQEN
jgi:hypothetical protein